MKLPEERIGTKSIEFYFQQFKRLVDTGIQIHLFLQSSMISLYKEVIGEPNNVFLEIQEFEDLELYKNLLNIDYNLPSSKTDSKDTANYIIVQNSKIYLVKKAIDTNKYNSDSFAWIDFGIGHVIKKNETLEDLKNIKLNKGLYIPGCYGQRNIDLNRICWRFCGGFFIGDKDSLEEFYNLYQQKFRELVENTKILSWEVNIWAIFEKYYNWKPIWYLADHNDSMLNLASNSVITSASS
jgi:hypothetical protein